MKKIPTIFKRNPDKMSEVTCEVHPDCFWVFCGEGIPRRKFDGVCCMFDENGFFKRREVKKGKKVPVGFILEQEDKITGKKFGWVPVDQTDTADKYFIEGFANRDRIIGIDYGTYELVGPKIQGNPERFTEHTLISHKYAETISIRKRTYSGIRDALVDLDIEGVVFHHPDGRMAKIKKSDFGLKR